MLEIINVILNIMLIPLFIGVFIIMYYLIEDIRRNRK